MSYVKNYDIGSIRADLPENQYTYELPLLSFGDIKHTINLSLVFNSKHAEENNFNIANGYKLNLQKAILINSGIPNTYIDSDGSRINLNRQGNSDIYTFDDESKRIIRKSGTNFKLENPDFSTEVFNSSGNINVVLDKYGDAYLRFSYNTNGKIIAIYYLKNMSLSGKSVNFTYDSESGNIAAITYNCSGTDVCTTTFSRNESERRFTVDHYSGMKYHTFYYSGNFMAYSSEDDSESIRSQKLICNRLQTSLCIERRVGPETIDRTTYSFLYVGFHNEDIVVTLPTFFPAIDVTDFHGVVTRIQYEGKKPVYSYELITQSGTNVYEKSFYTDENGRNYYGGTVNIHKNNLSAIQTINDGIGLSRRETSYNECWEIASFESSQNIYGKFLITGWVYPSGQKTSLEVHVRDQDDNYDSPTHSETIENLVPSMWNYIAVECELKNPRSLTVDFDGDISSIYSVDFRLTFLEGKIYGTEDLTHIISTKDVLTIEGSEPSDDNVLFFDNVKFLNGSVEITERMTANDVLRYMINQKYGTNTGEIYCDDCKTVIPNAGTLKFKYTTPENDLATEDIENVAVGKYCKSDDKVSYTKTLYQTNSSSISFFRTKTIVNNTEVKSELYDDNLDVTYTISENIETDCIRTHGLTTRYVVGGNPIFLAEYSLTNGVPTNLLNTTNEYGGVTTYTTDSVWGAIIGSSMEDEVSVTDTFDDDKTTLLTRAFSAGENSISHQFSYDQSGLLSTLRTGSLSYGFGYSYESLRSISKNASQIAHFTISDDKRTVTAKYPSQTNPLYTVTQTVDKYGRLTSVSDEVSNTYNLYSSASDEFIDLNNGSSKLAQSTDHITGVVSKYKYDGDKVESIKKYSSEGSLFSKQTFAYDDANRLINTSYSYDPGILDNKKTQTIYNYVKSDTDAYIDNRVASCEYKLNLTTKSLTSNTYDGLKRISQKETILTNTNNSFNKVFGYDGTKLEFISEEWGPIDTLYKISLGKNFYTYDSCGRIVTNTCLLLNQSKLNKYTYDSFGQLIREDNKILDKTILYCYNDIGNIVSAETFGYTTGAVTPGTGAIQNYTYDTTYPDRLKSFNGKGITYNSLHCPSNYDGKSWYWTNGKLTKVRRGSANQPGSEYKDCTFTYDGYGRRIRKHYIYDPNPAVAGDGNYYYEINYDYDESGRLIREFCTTHYDDQTESTREFIFLYDESGIIGTMYSLNGAELAPYYYRRNLQGDVIAIHDQNGAKKVEYAYDAFGNCTVLYSGITDLANNNPIRYRGYYYDKETGLYYLNSRYYNPEWRRFISPDSTDYIDSENINGLNLYAYCNNDPVNYVDPSGHSISLALFFAAILLFTPIGGSLLQVATSALSYVGISVASIFNEDIRNDMNAIGWNPFNTNESNVLNSSKVSFYKGVPVFRTNMDRSGSFGAIFLRRGWTDSKGFFHKLNDTNELMHERGHNWQLMMMGVANYGLMIGLPSWREWSDRPYYDRPWEITADVFGGAGRTHSQADINRGYWYLGTSSLSGPLGYLFLLGE